MGYKVGDKFVIKIIKEYNEGCDNEDLRIYELNIPNVLVTRKTLDRLPQFEDEHKRLKYTVRLQVGDIVKSGLDGEIYIITGIYTETETAIAINPINRHLNSFPIMYNEDYVLGHSFTFEQSLKEFCEVRDDN